MDILHEIVQKHMIIANVAQESEQNKKVENMLDLDNVSVSEECAMICMELQHEDGDEDLVVYRDQGISTEEYEKAIWGAKKNPK